MAKKKKRKGGKGFLKGVTSLVGGTASWALKVLPVAIILFILGAGFCEIKEVLYADGGLSVQRVTVAPSQSISVLQYEKIQNQVLGKNILNIDLKKIANSLEKDPAIQSARVIRRLPSEIRIEVTKRHAVAYLRIGNQPRAGLISNDGIILDTVDTKDAMGLIIEIVGTNQTLPGIGQSFKSRAFFEAEDFLQAYNQNPFSQEEPITKIMLDPLGNVSIILKQGPEIRLGRRPMQRLDAFKKIKPLLESEMRSKIEYLDLQFDDVIVKQKKGVK